MREVSVVQSVIDWQVLIIVSEGNKLIVIRAVLLLILIDSFMYAPYSPFLGL